MDGNGLILLEIKNRIGIVTLNNPEKRNALSKDLLNELLSTFSELKNLKIRVVILRAHKDAKVWSAGHDVNELPLGEDPIGFENPLEETLRCIPEYPGPVIALVQGGVWGGACDLALSCDMIIGDPTSTFAMTPAKLGVPYNATGILNFINRIGLSEAKEMFYTGAPVDADTALHFGVLNHIIPSEEIENFTFELAEKIALNSPLSIAVIKEQFRILTGSVPITPEAFERIEALRKRVYCSGDYKEGLKAFKEKRKPEFKGE